MNDTKTEKTFSGDFCNAPSRGGGETYKCPPIVDFNKQYKIGDFEHAQRDFKFIDVVFQPAISGDSKPPERIVNSFNRTPQQIAAELEHKLRQNSIRRQIHINNIIQRSRQQNEKVLKIREKMASKKKQEALQIELDLRKRREEAEKTRQNFLNERVQKFRRQIEHAEAVKSKKNDDHRTGNPVRTAEDGSGFYFV